MNPLAFQIARFLQVAGISTNVTAEAFTTTLEAAAAQYAAIIPTNLLIPALIYSLNQILTASPTISATGFVYYGIYGSAGPQFSPTSAGALAIDLISRRQWQYAANVWS